MIRVALVTRAIDPAALIASIASTGYGAISLFAGTVRDTSHGRAVSAIDYSAYTSMAEAELEQIVAEAADRFGVTSLIVEGCFRSGRPALRSPQRTRIARRRSIAPAT